VRNLVLHPLSLIVPTATKYHKKDGTSWWRTRFFAALRMTKWGLTPKFNGIPTHLILRCAQNDKGGAMCSSPLLVAQVISSQK
jgi:hypothetical protein